jgi:hypothetical protein
MSAIMNNYLLLTLVCYFGCLATYFFAMREFPMLLKIIGSALAAYLCGHGTLFFALPVGTFSSSMGMVNEVLVFQTCATVVATLLLQILIMILNKRYPRKKYA